MVISAKFGAKLATSLPLDIMRKAFGIFELNGALRFVEIPFVKIYWYS